VLFEVFFLQISAQAELTSSGQNKIKSMKKMRRKKLKTVEFHDLGPGSGC
jgi:hypothetical protein